jgi:hypothetical protein
LIFVAILRIGEGFSSFFHFSFLNFSSFVPSISIALYPIFLHHQGDLQHTAFTYLPVPTSILLADSAHFAPEATVRKGEHRKL